jgi:hypothetical protein
VAACAEGRGGERREGEEHAGQNGDSDKRTHGGRLCEVVEMDECVVG